jgi:hypothetical protein
MKVMNLEETHTYKYCEKYKENLPEIRCQIKDTFEYMVINNCKIEFVSDAIDKNPYNSTHFSWIDFNISYIFKDLNKSLNYLIYISTRNFKDNIFLTLSRKRFTQEVQVRFPAITRPREGDLIYFPLSKSVFEINFVEHENPFYSLGKLYSYRLTCELFTYDQEGITTGTSDIDAVRAENIEYVGDGEYQLINSEDGTPAGDNDEIETEATELDLFNFTEKDPFSEGNY